MLIEDRNLLISSGLINGCINKWAHKYLNWLVTQRQCDFVLKKIINFKNPNSCDLPHAPRAIILSANEKMAIHIQDEVEKFCCDSICKVTVAYKYGNSDEVLKNSQIIIT